MDDAQQLRYSRHLLLDEWSDEVQGRLTQAHALVIGAGGLGAPALLYLAAAGVGRITVIDPDVVELSNLQRQVAHTTPHIGMAKVHSAQRALATLNPEVCVYPCEGVATEAWLAEQLPHVQVVLDCTDAFQTRQLINRMAYQHGVPVVSASAVRFDGQLSVFDPRKPDSPCYACLYPPDRAPEETRCALMGVFGPVVGTMGVMQAGEALKLLAGLESGAVGGHEGLSGRLLMLDGRDWSMTRLRVQRDPSCPVCGAGH